MADYDSDSSLDSSSGDIRTRVLLGYASSTPTSDDFSQIGGHATWLDPIIPPPAELAKCKVCKAFMSLLLQLHADLPEKFPGHERRLYLWVCRRKACRRKEGSVRGFRGVRVVGGSGERKVVGWEKKEAVAEEEVVVVVVEEKEEDKKRVGEMLFGVKSNTAAGGNPFATNGASNAKTNPFASASSHLAAKPAQKPTSQKEAPASSSITTTLSETSAASKPHISAPPSTNPSEPWPSASSFPTPFPTSHLDAGAEYIDPPTAPTALPHIPIDTSSETGHSVKDAFESSMDRTFQKFADRLSQNPEQVLRYEFAGPPLLYSKSDATGRLLSSPADGKVGGKGIPRCGSCGSGRVFELQLTPRLIEEVEREDLGLDGMDWGTIMLGTCARDCGEGTDFREEWVGVQWEESASHKSRPM